ncbi:MAG: glycosyltransferase family 1 protein [Calditrichaeota bacterium]|nr:MAG: glycosyltransferase family 1 protein [Calditrichota bacterium]
MRILYHHRTLGDGAEGIHIREMVNALRSLGHKVELVSLVKEEQLITPQKKETKPRWYWVKRLIPGVLFEILEILYNFFGYRMILKAARKFNPDAIYDRYISYNYSAIKVAKKLKIPCILEVNSPYATQRRIWERIYFPRLIQWFETKITNDADRVIVVSSALKDHLIAHGTKPEKIVVMPNGIDPRKFSLEISDKEYRKRYHLTEQHIVIGFVGVFRHWHNLEILFDVFQELIKQFDNLRMMLIGDGAIQEDLENRAKILNIRDKVIFTGRIPHQEMAGHISIFDIAISPHATYYSSPMKIVEYMAMGKCVVAPDMKNIRDLIKPGETGYLFVPQDKEDLFEKLKYLICNKSVRLNIGKAAAEEVRKNFTWEKNAREVVRLFSELQTENNNKKFSENVNIVHNSGT